jgi:hypothetical protein
MNAALRHMGISQDEHTAHGFRATASTILNESVGFPPTQSNAHWGIKIATRFGARIRAAPIGWSGSRWRNGGPII